MHIGPIVPDSGCFKLSGRIRVSKVHVTVRVSLITVKIRVRLGLWLGLMETVLINTTQNLRIPNPPHYWQEHELYNLEV